jgi:ABC-type transport system involved in multi-copper enzyme maturation permease subunit
MTAARSSIPGTLSTVLTLAGVTLRRLRRGKAMWIGLGIAALPVVNATIVDANQQRFRASPSEMFVASLVLLALLPAMFIGASIGEEIEERTSTYLWSRPIVRWGVIAGKLCALAPIVLVLIVGGWFAVHEIWAGGAPTPLSIVALGAGCLAASLAAAGIATIVPRHGMSFTIAYMLIDLFIGALPFSLRELSITYQTALLSQLGDAPPELAAPAITLLVLSAIWSAIAYVRIQRLEA